MTVNDADRRWAWKVRSYKGRTFCVETVHATVASRDEELSAIAQLGRRAEVFSRMPDGTWAVHNEGAES